MTLKTNTIYLAFSDESRHNINRYRSIAVLSLPSSEYDSLSMDFATLLRESGIHELKWKNLSSARVRFAAEKTVDLIRARALIGKIRIDILTWDIKDRRHLIMGRDDRANLQRMYFHLFNNIIQRRWGHSCDWRLYPDQQSLVNWDEMKEYLESRIGWVHIAEDGKWNDPSKIRQAWMVERIREVNSLDCNLVQIPDLFAGLGSFSWTQYPKFKEWERLNRGQMTLFPQTSDICLSNSDRERCNVLHRLYSTCNDCGLTMSINHKKGLWTPNPGTPINFWFYESRFVGDTAPTKENQ